MSASRVEIDINNFKLALEKALETDGSLETFTDTISALKKIPISIDLLRKTKIGQTLQDIKKKHNGNDIGILAKNLLVQWKRDCESSNSTSSNAEPSKKLTIQPKAEVETKSSSSEVSSAKSPRNEEEENLVEMHYNKLAPIRKKVMDLFVECFNMQANSEVVSKFLSFNVEASIHAVHSSERDQKAYLNKARSLSFNLKKNEDLRKDIVEGRLQAEHLVHLSTSELATKEIREEREKTTKMADLARRGDLYEITRAEILTANGIDPNKGGEFCCRRCKGTKTTHYAMQTRSSDEPMTVFVCCLTCGNRWRCT